MKRKLAFLWDWEIPMEWRFQDQDGIWAALRIMAREWDVRVFTRGAGPHSTHHDGLQWQFTTMPELGISEFKPDVILCWGSLDRPWWELVHKHNGVPMALCFAGGPTQHPYLSYFQHVFVESQVYEDAFAAQGITVSRAFGTNTKFFISRRVRKVWRAIYPSAFCRHKQIELFCQAVRDGGLVVGGHNDEALVGKALSLGTSVLPRVSANTLRWLYNMSGCCVVPAGPDGGGQRVCLEAMSCGIPVIVMDNNDKCKDFLSAPGCTTVEPFPSEIREVVDVIYKSGRYPAEPIYIREWVVENYGEGKYAEALARPLEVLCQTSSTS